MMGDSVPDRTRGFSPKCTDHLCGQPTFLCSRNHDASLRGQAAGGGGGEPCHSSPSSTKVVSGALRPQVRKCLQSTTLLACSLLLSQLFKFVNYFKKKSSNVGIFNVF
jgi:hypothetical protein